MPSREKSSSAFVARRFERRWISSFGSGSRPIRSSPPALEAHHRAANVPVTLRVAMFDELNDLYQQVILDHCKKPRNFHELPGATCSAQGHNPLCGDQLNLFLTVEGDVIKDISFVGSGCCISKASASLLTEHAKGKSRTDIRKMFDQIHEMVTTGRVKGDVGK